MKRIVFIPTLTLLFLSCGPEDMLKDLPTVAPTDTATSYLYDITENFSFEGSSVNSIQADRVTQLLDPEQRCYAGHVHVVLFQGKTILNFDSLLLGAGKDDLRAIVPGAFELIQDSVTIKGSGLEVENWFLWENYTIKGMTGEFRHSSNNSPE